MPCYAFHDLDIFRFRVVDVSVRGVLMCVRWWMCVMLDFPTSSKTVSRPSHIPHHLSLLRGLFPLFDTHVFYMGNLVEFYFFLPPPLEPDEVIFDVDIRSPMYFCRNLLLLSNLSCSSFTASIRLKISRRDFWRIFACLF
jgi:hypothetical protein